MKTARFLCASAFVALFCATASAQSPLCTLWAANNGLSNGSTVFFDITVYAPVEIYKFDCDFITPAVGLPCGMTVHTCPTTYLGNELNTAPWTQVAQDDGTAIAAGRFSPTTVTLKVPFILTPGTYGMKLVGDPVTGHSYTGTGSTTGFMTFANAELSLYLGSSVSNTGTLIFSPRVWNGCIHYNPACWKKYGSGCAGTGGFVPQLDLTGCAVVGQPLTVTMTQGMGGVTAVFLFGAGQGPLPMGAGCYLNFSTLFPVVLVVPTGGSGPGNGTVSLAGIVPAGTAGYTVNMQAFTQDPGGPIGYANSPGLEFGIK